MMTLALLVTAATGAWADDLYVEIAPSGKSATIYWGNPGTNVRYMMEAGFSVNAETVADAVKTIETLDIDESCKNHTLNSLNSLFQEWHALTTINNIENLKTAGVQSMNRMFYLCSALKTLDLTSFNTESVTAMSSMFSSCSALQTVDLSSFNTENVQYMNAMFYLCSALKTLDLTSFNTAKVQNMSYMFNGCSNLENIYVGDGWNTAAVTNGSSMFVGCSKLPNWNGTVTHAMAKLTDDGGYLKTKPIELAWDPVTKTATLDEMPEGNVLVDVEYYSRAGVTLSVTGQTQGGTAKLLKKLDDGSFADMTDADQVREDNKFILMVDKEDGYDFKVPDATFEEFTEDEYVEYYNWAKDNDINVPLTMALLWVTMPHVDSGNLNLEVNFQQMSTFTILYQPATGQNPKVVACKMERNVNGTPEVSYTAMQRGASMGDGTAVWTMTMQAAYGPTKIAFVPVADGTTEADLQASLESASLSTATISQNADTWKELSGAKYLIYGGNAKVATAIFVADGSSMTVFKDLEADEATTEGGMTYRLGVCITDAQGRVTTPGTVTAPAAPDAPQGKQFGGWRGLTYVDGRPTESIFTAGSTINVYGTTTFTAVWNPIQIQTTFALNGGTGVTSPVTKDYQETLSDIGEATRKGFVLDYWKVAKSVNESGILFGKGSQYNLETPLTADLSLQATWKHVHEYISYPISAFGSALEKYMKYNGVLHVAICNCDDVEIVEHEFNPAGKCACGYVKPGATKVQLDIAYGRLEGTTFTTFMNGFPQFAKTGEEVKVEAFHNWGDLEFKTWQYSTDGGQTWEELAAFEIVGFLIPCSMKVRALYVNPVQTPTIELASSAYDDKAEYQGQTYTMGNILYQMSYKLPDGYKLLDAGIRMGDNAGISYYIEQTAKYSLDAEAKGVAAGIGAGVVAVGVVSNVFLGGGFDVFGFTKDYTQAMFDETESVVYVETEDNVIEKEDKIDAAILAKKMYESTPINVEKYDPIYWEAKAPTKGLFGSICTTPPLRFAQKNNQDHYIYGIAYMRYETPDKQMKTLYTDAIAATVNNPSQYTSKMEQQPGARQMSFGAGSLGTDLGSATGARKAPKHEPEQQPTAEQIDMSTITAPQTQLYVYADGTWQPDLSGTYGYGQTVTVNAPAVTGKTFSYWTADGAVVSTASELTLTMNANTTLRAIYDATDAPAQTAAAILSATRSADGQKIVLTGKANGTFENAGFVYSTTNSEPTRSDDGIVAVKYSSLPTNGGDQNFYSVLDKNNCFTFELPVEDESTVYYVRAFTKNGSTTNYSDVREIKLASLKSRMMMVANLEAFDHDSETSLDEQLTQLRESGQLVAGFPVEVPAGEYVTYYKDAALTLSSTSEDIAQLYTITSVAADKATATPLTVAAAETPLLVKNTSDETQTILLMPTEEAADNVTAANEFVGTLEDTQIAASTEDLTNYAFNGLKFVMVRKALDVDANRAWLAIPTSTARSISIVFGDATSIDHSTLNIDHSSDAVYDLSGRKVAAPTTKGVYVKNGKKVVK